jgi:hypothetical protein
MRSSERGRTAVARTGPAGRHLCGRVSGVRHLARDHRALEAQLRDIRHDQRDIYRDEQSYQRWR